MKITYIRHGAIDRAKWDRAIEGSLSPLAYGYSWYLDGMTNHQWDALVAGDYEAVFPLPWKSKYGLKYIYQPYFCQQLGLFAPAGFTLSTADFIRAIPRKFILIDLQVNLYHSGKELPGRLRDNFQLPLDQPYEELYKGFSQDVKNNLKKSEKGGIIYSFGIPFSEVIRINRGAWGELNPGVQPVHYEYFSAVCEAAGKNGHLVTIGAYQNDTIIGAALLFRTPLYLFYVISGKTEEGRKTGVMNGIVAEIVRKYTLQGLILDFEGSEIEGVAYFYKKFGSRNTPYLHFKKYNLF